MMILYFVNCCDGSIALEVLDWVKVARKILISLVSQFEKISGCFSLSLVDVDRE